MNILAIETSCDETAISILEAEGGMEHASFCVRANIVHSQVEQHKEYGGVFPSLAKREHSQNLVPVLCEALAQGFGKSKVESQKLKEFSSKKVSKLEKILEREPGLFEQFIKAVPKENPRVDAIAVTHGPGLEPALWVGVNFAKALAHIWGAPLVPVNHMEGHIFSAFMKGGKKNSEFRIMNYELPMLALLVSGGHTELVLIKDWLHYEKIGQTRDDAAGEAFDKVARLLGLPYPGGPAISELARKWKTQNTSNNLQTNSKFQIPNSKIKLPRPMLTSGDYDFSFSGLKTAVLYMVRDIPEMTNEIRAAIAYEFQEAVVDVLVKKTLAAAQEYNVKTILLGGGVAANNRLREELETQIKSQLPHTTYKMPDTKYTGDNAAMIAVAGYYRYLHGDTKQAEEISANGNLSL